MGFWTLGAGYWVLGGRKPRRAQRGRLMHKYEIIINWNNEDGAFVAEVPNGR